MDGNQWCLGCSLGPRVESTTWRIEGLVDHRTVGKRKAGRNGTGNQVADVMDYCN